MRRYALDYVHARSVARDAAAAVVRVYGRDSWNATAAVAFRVVKRACESGSTAEIVHVADILSAACDGTFEVRQRAALEIRMMGAMP